MSSQPPRAALSSQSNVSAVLSQQRLINLVEAERDALAKKAEQLQADNSDLAAENQKVGTMRCVCVCTGLLCRSVTLCVHLCSCKSRR
jgi:hypothetical protein